MKSILSRQTLLTCALLFMVATPALTQQLASLNYSDAPKLTGSESSRVGLVEQQEELKHLQKRKAALQRYLSTLNTPSVDYQTTERAIRDLDASIGRLLQQQVAAEPASATQDAAQGARLSADNETASSAAPHGKIVISSGDWQGSSRVQLNVKVDPSITRFRVVVRDKNGEKVFSKTVRDLMRGVDKYTEAVDLADGENTITVNDPDGNAISNVLTLTGGMEAARRRAVAAAAPVRRRDDDNCATSRKECGVLVGLAFFGMVGSQQAKDFSQFDPFGGGIVGYTSQTKNLDKWYEGKFNLRFQGIFTASPRTASAPPDTTATPSPLTPTPDFKAFISSRKSFDIETHLLYEFKPLSHILALGPYAAFGGSTVLDKNELANDKTVAVESGPSTSGGTAQDVKLDTSRAIVANDIKSYQELGMVMDFWENYQNPAERKLYVQAILAAGHYEALGGLYQGYNTTRRAIGKLRVFPTGLGLAKSENKRAFMFGVDLNAGRGEDFIRFFTGFIMNFSKVNAEINPTPAASHGGDDNDN